MLLPFYSSREGCNKILVSVTMDLELKEGLMGTKEKKCKLVPSFVVKIDSIFYHKLNKKGFKIKWMCKTFIIIAQCSLHINYTLI